MREAAIVSTARTGIGKAYRGYFNATEAPVLAGHVMNAAVERASLDPARIDDVFWGVGNQWGTTGGNAGRMALFAGALPESVPAFTLDRKCGSGLNAVALAARTIMCGEADVALAGGMESISFTVTKDAPRYVNRSVVAHEPAAYVPMIETAEIVATRYGISREANRSLNAADQWENTHHQSRDQDADTDQDRPFQGETLVIAKVDTGQCYQQIGRWNQRNAVDHG